MIENEKQLKITRTAAAKFARALDQFDERPEAHPGVDPRLIPFLKAAIKGQLADLNEEIREYKQKRNRSKS